MWTRYLIALDPQLLLPCVTPDTKVDQIPRNWICWKNGMASRHVFPFYESLIADNFQKSYHTSHISIHFAWIANALASVALSRPFPVAEQPCNLRFVDANFIVKFCECSEYEEREYTPSVVVECTRKLPHYFFIVAHSIPSGNARPIIWRTNEKSGLLAKWASVTWTKRAEKEWVKRQQRITRLDW